MKKLLSIILTLLPFCAFAQTGTLSATSATEAASVLGDSIVEPATASPLSIAVFSYEQCWNALPELAVVKAEMEGLRSQYAAELKRAEADFNAKYEDFLEQQAKLANSIRNKRQSELQRIMEENLAFKAQAQQTLANTEAAKLAPLKEKLQQAIEKVAREGGYNMAINRDNNGVPYIDGVRIADITETIIGEMARTGK